MLSNVIVDVTISRRSFVFGQSRTKVSAGFTNVSSLTVAAFERLYCSRLSSGLSWFFTLVSSRRKVVIAAGLCETRIICKVIAYLR